jgi:uncharacterized membrane protein
MDAMTVEQAITAEQARHIHAQIPTAVIGGFVIACIAAAVFAGGAARGPLAAWLGANLLVAVFRFASWQVFRRNPFDAGRWLCYAMAGAALSGAVWGAGALFMFDSPDIAYHLL